MDPSLTETSQKINLSIEHLKVELSAIRAGRANPSLVENISVLVYGSKMKLVELGTISAPQPALLTVQVWDASIVENIVKALQEANLGLNPSSEGQIIRLPIPPLTAQRRAEFIKLANAKIEDAKVEVRQVRQKTREQWEKDKKAGGFGEDEFDRRSKLLQELVDKVMDQLDQISKLKEEELTRL